jgi:hypothetical protein
MAVAPVADRVAGLQRLEARLATLPIQSGRCARAAHGGAASVAGRYSRVLGRPNVPMGARPGCAVEEKSSAPAGRVGEVDDDDTFRLLPAFEHFGRAAPMMPEEEPGGFLRLLGGLAAALAALPLRARSIKASVGRSAQRAWRRRRKETTCCGPCRSRKGLMPSQVGEVGKVHLRLSMRVRFGVVSGLGDLDCYGSNFF